MATLVLDELLEASLREQRFISGGDRYDEVWDGIYRMIPLPNNEHQQLIGGFCIACHEVLRISGNGIVLPGANVSDQEVHWEKNYRAPDVVVLKGSRAVDRCTHWFGGPDLLVAIASPHDATRDKIPFYSKIGVRELLIVDRNPWALELYRLVEGELRLIGRADAANRVQIESEVMPLTFQLISASPRPRIEVRSRSDDKRWTI